MNGPTDQTKLSPGVWRRVLVVLEQLALRSDLDGVLRLIIDSMRDSLDADRASVFQYDHDTDELFATQAHGVDQALRFPSDSGLAGAAITGRSIVNVPDCYSDARFNRSIDLQTGYRTRCMLSVPLISHDGILEGVVQVLNRRADADCSPVFEARDVEIARALASQAAIAMRRARLIDAERRKEKIEADLQIAREIQQATRPATLPSAPGYEFALAARSAEETGGDAADLFLTDDGRVGLLLADASGHGIGPALSVTRVAAMVRMGLGTGMTPDAVVSQVNRQLCGTLPVGRFVTAYLGVLDPGTGVLTAVAAGQAPILVLRADGSVEVIEASAMPLGIDRDRAIAGCSPVELAPGDALLALTDGYFERQDASGHSLGTRGVSEIASRLAGSSASEVLCGIDAAIASHAGETASCDDETGIVVRRG